MRDVDRQAAASTGWRSFQKSFDTLHRGTAEEDEGAGQELVATELGSRRTSPTPLTNALRPPSHDCVTVEQRSFARLGRPARRAKRCAASSTRA